MNTLAAFPVFKYYFNGEGYFPLIPLYISTHNQQLKLHALIDSGATISVFRNEVAEQLGEVFFKSFRIIFEEKKNYVKLE